MDLVVPALVRDRANSHGAVGRSWLDGLAVTVAELAEAWGLTLGSTYAAGTAGLVLSAVDTHGVECVLKVAMPIDAAEREQFAHSVRAHELANGNGCARLLGVHDAHNAMLLERLGPNLSELALDLPDMLDIITDTLLSFWRPLGETTHDFMSGADKAVCLADFIARTWEDLDQPCERAVIDTALRYCERRESAFDPVNAVLVHGDAHGWNTVQADPGSFKFVDPEGLASERAHDLAVPMREYNAELLDGDTAQLARDRCDRLASRCNVDSEAVWEWGFIERVSTGLVNLQDFSDDSEGRRFLRVAELVSGVR